MARASAAVQFASAQGTSDASNFILMASGGASIPGGAIAATSIGQNELFNTFEITGGGGPVLDHVGNLYGTTSCDGAHARGSVFKLTPSMGTWIYTLLYDFTGGSDGGSPNGNLVFDSNGNLYGTASCGGSTGTCPHGDGGSSRLRRKSFATRIGAVDHRSDA